MTLCDTESAPEFTKTCTPDSDKNDLTGTNPKAANYIGKHPGNAFMELQFYPPGYVEQFEGFGCTATQYCAAMTIDSRTVDQNHGDSSGAAIENTDDCNNYILGGGEPINWAYITRSGRSQAPANPLFTGTFANPHFAAVNPDPTKDLMMNPGDRILIHMHDTPAGLQINLVDLSTGQTGSMTASIANGFGHILYTPTSSTCQEAPYAFHPEYSTANTRGNTWSVHTYNIAMSDEIGHFENCLELDATFNCAVPGSQDAGGVDEDDGNNFCVPGEDSTLVKIDGCFSDDLDWDGQSYQADWPGTNPKPSADRALHPTPVLFSSPVTSRGRNYPTIAFETDLPNLEAAQDNPPFCDRSTGANCVNPRRGLKFVERVNRWGPKFTWPAIIITPFLPLPNAIVYAVAGWTGMSWVTFLVLDAIGSLAWAGMLAGLGYALGQHAVSVAQTVSRYGLWVSIGIVVLVVAGQMRNARAQR